MTDPARHEMFESMFDNSAALIPNPPHSLNFGEPVTHTSDELF